MSNLIRGYNPDNSHPFVIDSDKSKIAIELSEQIRAKQALSSETSVDGFSAGIMAAKVNADEHVLDSEGTSTNAPEVLESYEPDVNIAYEAAQTIQEAMRDANEIRMQAKEEIEDVKAQTIVKYKEEGYQQGLQQAEDEINQLKAQLEEEQQHFKQQMETELEQNIMALEPRFADLVCRLLERLTGVVVDGEEEVVLYLINHAMKNVDNSHSFVISLSEEDYPYVYEHQTEIYGALNPGVKVELFQDAKLQKNQCKIETDNGLIDVSLDLQLKQMMKCLKMLNA